MTVIIQVYSLHRRYWANPLLVSRKWSQHAFALPASPGEPASFITRLPTRRILFTNMFPKISTVPSSLPLTSSRCHLSGLLWTDVPRGQLGEESRQPVLCFRSCLRVQPGQTFFQQVILEIWELRLKLLHKGIKINMFFPVTWSEVCYLSVIGHNIFLYLCVTATILINHLV